MSIVGCAIIINICVKINTKPIDKRRCNYYNCDMDIGNVIIIQKKGKLTDATMAESIGISRGYYNKMKKGKLKLTPKVILRIYERYSEFFLPEGFTKAIIDSGKQIIPHQASPNQKSGGWLIRCWESFKRAFIYP